jgi:hypothetical protein
MQPVNVGIAQQDIPAGVPAPVEARERLGVAVGAAILGAGLFLVVAVLPAEYGIDPTGIGRKLGLTALNDTQRAIDAYAATKSAGAGGAPLIVPQDHGFQSETVEFKIAGRDFMEYKYRLDRGQALHYSWKATGPVNVEFHAEPDGAPKGYAESYEKLNGVESAAGTLNTRFPGIHGWYWENLGDKEITVTLSAAGFFNMSHEFRKNAPPTTKIFNGTP